jgi:hypothetical protein
MNRPQFIHLIFAQSPPDFAAFACRKELDTLAPEKFARHVISSFGPLCKTGTVAVPVLHSESSGSRTPGARCHFMFDVRYADS